MASIVRSFTSILLPLTLLGTALAVGVGQYSTVSSHQRPFSDNNPTKPSASAFTVWSDGTAQPGCRDSKPNPASIEVGVIEFDDNGSFAKMGQLEDVIGCIDRARQQNPNGAVVILFIHGWHHNAAWHIQRNQGDAHFGEFRRILMSLALREAERGTAGRRVIGIYFGWNGDPKEGFWHKFNEKLSFWNRYDVASQIANNTGIRESILQIINHTKDPLPSGMNRDSPLVMIGHSMGALILETSFLSLVRQRSGGIGEAPVNSSSACAFVESQGRAVKFPDLILLLNSAAESKVTTELAQQTEQKQLRKAVRCGVSFNAPLIISATSQGDTATRVWFPAAKGGRNTAANTPGMLTHQLVRDSVGHICTPKSWGRLMVDYGQSWHCLRQPAITNGTLTSIATDLPQSRQLRDPCHIRYRLEPIAQRSSESPYWIFQVPTTIIKDHNDVFNPQSSLLIMALTQTAGAVMSLAPTWDSIFEPEEGICALPQ